MNNYWKSVEQCLVHIFGVPVDEAKSKIASNPYHRILAPSDHPLHMAGCILKQEILPEHVEQYKAIADHRTNFEKELTESQCRQIEHNPTARRQHQRELLRLDLGNLVTDAMEKTMISEESLLERSGASKEQFDSFMMGDECDILIAFDLLSAMNFSVSLRAEPFNIIRTNDQLPKLT